MVKERRTRAGWLVGLLFCLPGSYVQGNAQTAPAAAQIPSSTVEHQRDVMVKVRDSVLPLPHRHVCPGRLARDAQSYFESRRTLLLAIGHL